MKLQATSYSIIILFIAIICTPQNTHTFFSKDDAHESNQSVFSTIIDIGLLGASAASAYGYAYIHAEVDKEKEKLMAIALCSISIACFLLKSKWDIMHAIHKNNCMPQKANHDFGKSMESFMEESKKGFDRFIAFFKQKDA